MKPMALTLKGFRGIRDGLGRSELSLDFAHLAGDAQLIAIVGQNGRGKSTVLDNMTPYPVMASRAGADGSGGFSYYEQVYLPENLKDLIWEHGGRRYRSQIVIRLHGKRKTEAYLHVYNQHAWHAVTLADGTVSDGKLDTYLRCVEAIVGSAQTFFTSMFAAQGRRQLSAYRNAEIKTLLADLLGLEEIRRWGAKAADTVKLLKAGLAYLRQEQAELQDDGEQLARDLARLGDTPQRIAAAQATKSACQQTLDGAKDRLAQMVARQQMAVQADVRRAQLQRDRDDIVADHAATLTSLAQQDQREATRSALLAQRVAQRRSDLERQRAALQRQRSQLDALLRDAARIDHARRRHPLAQRIATAREGQVRTLRARVDQLNQCAAQARLLQEKMAAIEHAAGEAVLKVQALARRHALTTQVPCAGSAWQQHCPLLADAREAHCLLPSADRQVRALELERAQLAQRLAACRAQAAPLRTVAHALDVAEQRWQRASAIAGSLALLAARQGELQQARSTAATVDHALAALPADASGDTAEEAVERAAIAEARQQIARRRASDTLRHHAALQRIDTALAQLPAPLDASLAAHAQQAVTAAQRAFAEAEAVYMAAVRDQHRTEDLLRHRHALAQQSAHLTARSIAIEQALGVWTLFARCMSNDGLIALSIDDAGPALARLANDLLLACYGPRFTVTIKTQVETGKGEAREGFDMVVHDAESASSKSVAAMSGGERVWINECLTRAIALYLAQDAGRHYATLFSDETDGALDAERKRMFIAMKREVLRLGGYQCEYFVSQTAELAALADAVIDLDRYQLRAPEALAGMPSQAASEG